MQNQGITLTTTCWEYPAAWKPVARSSLSLRSIYSSVSGSAARQSTRLANRRAVEPQNYIPFTTPPFWFPKVKTFIKRDWRAVEPLQIKVFLAGAAIFQGTRLQLSFIRINNPMYPVQFLGYFVNKKRESEIGIELSRISISYL